MCTKPCIISGRAYSCGHCFECRKEILAKKEAEGLVTSVPVGRSRLARNLPIFLVNQLKEIKNKKSR